jgi:hypothetical protein
VTKGLLPEFIKILIEGSKFFGITGKVLLCNYFKYSGVANERDDSSTAIKNSHSNYRPTTFLSLDYLIFTPEPLKIALI